MEPRSILAWGIRSCNCLHTIALRLTSKHTPSLTLVCDICHQKSIDMLKRLWYKGQCEGLGLQDPAPNLLDAWYC